MRIVLVVAALAVFGLVGCSSNESGTPTAGAVSSTTETTTAGPATETLIIMAQIAPGRSTPTPDGGCQGALFQSGLREDGYVSVTDAEGAVVGASTYGSGVLQPDGTCRLLAYTDVIVGSPFYTVDMGTGDPVVRPAEKALADGIGVGYGY